MDATERGDLPSGGMSSTTGYRQYRFRRPPGACELLLVRHGESEAADPERPFPTVDGHADPGLHPDGRVQAQQVSERLLASGEDFAAVYVTTLRRTHQTARPLLEGLGMEPRVVPELREVHLGDLEGGGLRRATAEGDGVLGRLWERQRWDAVPNAERDETFSDRVRAGIEQIAADHPDAAVAVFTHGGVIGKILQLATGARGLAFVGADNASISHLVVTGDQWIVRAFNDTSHLGPRYTRDPEPLV